MRYAIVGNGTAVPKEVHQGLESLWDAVEAKDPKEAFSLIFIAEDKPSETVSKLLGWVQRSNCFHEVLCADREAMKGTIYEGADEYIETQKPHQKLIRHLAKIADEEEVAMLVLDDKLDENDDLLLLLTDFVDAGGTAFDLTAQMVQLDFGDPVPPPSDPPVDDDEAPLDQPAVSSPVEQAPDAPGRDKPASAEEIAASAKVSDESDGPVGLPLKLEDIEDLPREDLRVLVTKHKAVVWGDKRQRGALIDALLLREPGKPTPEAPTAEEQQEETKEKVSKPKTMRTPEVDEERAEEKLGEAMAEAAASETKRTPTLTEAMVIIFDAEAGGVSFYPVSYDAAVTLIS